MKSTATRSVTSVSRLSVIAFALILLGAVAACCLSGCDSEKSEAQDAFKAASSALDEKNAEVDAAIADLQEVIGSEIKPLDEVTTKAAEEAISTAQGAKVTAPQMASDTDGIKEQTAELEKGRLQSATRWNREGEDRFLENSIKQREQVTNPSEAFVIQRLTGVEHIETPTAVTEDHDPNGRLGKQGRVYRNGLFHVRSR